MNRRPAQVSYPLGLVLFVLLLACYKAVILTTGMGAYGYTFLVFVGLDAFYLSLFLIVALLQAYIRPKWLRATFGILLILMMFLYLVDSFVLLALDEHASFFEIARYTPEWGVILSFFKLSTYIFVLLFLLSLFVFVNATATVKKLGLVLLFLVLFAAASSVISTPGPLKSYAMLSPQQLLEELGPQQSVASYSAGEVEFYAGLDQHAAHIPESKPDIILLIVESLSSINSEKVSSTPGFLDGFDELAEEGVLFRNFFANHQASEGGLIALLAGFPPMHFPTASPYMFDEFAVQTPVVSEYQQQGYFVEFLTSADLTFIGLDHFLSGLGLDRSRGRDEVDTMRNAPRVVQDAPSDVYLYREALRTALRLKTLDQPFLLTIATTSTHLPYTHPEGGPDTPQAVWEWSVQQLLSFHQQLFESGFFDNGILLITGDHRQMRPVTTAEVERYGASARARVPLLVIGEAFQQGQTDDRFFQQSDLLRMLGRINQLESSLSPYPIWVERYNRKYGRMELINRLVVFDEADRGRHEYRLEVPGNRIEWLDEKPGFARRLETSIHSQRSRHQQKRNSLDDPIDQSH